MWRILRLFRKAYDCLGSDHNTHNNPLKPRESIFWSFSCFHNTTLSRQMCPAVLQADLVNISKGSQGLTLLDMRILIAHSGITAREEEAIETQAWIQHTDVPIRGSDGIKHLRNVQLRREDPTQHGFHSDVAEEIH
ncbi:hypothetical protein SRHO_G00114240 [Serrasalmus rhombeus]